VTGVAILGSTGSVGRQAIEVVQASGGRLRVTALAAQRSAKALAEQAHAVRPDVVALADEAGASELRRLLPAGVRLEAGPSAVAALAAADGAEVVLNAITGSAGLRSTLVALDAGRRLALANKESLIVGGELVTARAAPGQIVPVDSEHSGLAQCLRAGTGDEVHKLVVTASGGPFRGRALADLERVTTADALAHPTWAMGPVITVNSATLMNKGLEVIEAHLLFGIPYERIEVVVHPQSVVHAMVEFADGATIAQLSTPDMRLPIGLALGWPARSSEPVGRIDWGVARQLTFEPVDRATFELLDVAVAAGRAGGVAPAVLNAANEEAVAAFLDGRLPFLGIPEVVKAVVAELGQAGRAAGLEALLAVERSSRALARTLVGELVGRSTAPGTNRGGAAHPGPPAPRAGARP
jgi:1-deoxy-D-xylulose-5-phosphate reductoisomerase